MHITIDHRENCNEAVAYLKIANIDYSIEQLKFGDYILNHRIVFERKTLTDFIQSIKDGRLFRQVYQRLNLDNPYIIILEGNTSSVQGSKMSRESIQGAMVHLAVFMGIPILRSKNYTETLKLMIMAGKQELRYDAVNKKQVYLRQPKSLKTIAKIQKIRLLQSLPGIGKTRAIDMLTEFGSIKNVLSASEKDLCKVPGIGKKTAFEIRKILD